MRVTTRPAVPGDEAVLSELNAFVHDPHVAHDPAYFKPAARDEVATWFRTLLEKEGTRIWITELDGEAVGYAIAVLRERAETPFVRALRWLEIDQIAVRPERRRTGVAGMLVSAVLQTADREGIAEVELSSWSFNTVAQEAFRRLGFTPKVVRFGWRPPER